jgi:hypothetical protein
MNKSIYFLGEKVSGVGIMRGKQVAEKLKNLGYTTEYRTFDAFSDIKNSIIFSLKAPLTFSDFEILKNNNNKNYVDSNRCR